MGVGGQGPKMDGKIAGSNKEKRKSSRGQEQKTAAQKGFERAEKSQISTMV